MILLAQLVVVGLSIGYFDPKLIFSTPGLWQKYFDYQATQVLDSHTTAHLKTLITIS
jgi:ABC-type antimicrobial peptide transport system permease subunit